MSEIKNVQSPLALPSPSDEAAESESGIITKVKLDDLGPMVVNTDGSLSRVANWEQMTEIERERFKKIVLARNAARLKALREKAETESAVGESH